ncbi:DUF262 domain-containing protein [Leptospira weilii]|uniref:PF03235 family protein n=2 Tax=Leptospira TaxID=171 RepID=M6QP22_9LEPT|nr:DUF262 domain-containing protein [Leptospira weilii]EMN90612.1 PF03235 family protein [Leptospira weilii str. UI 13098]
MENSEWLEIENLEDDVYPITEYDLVSTPNDFNVMTLTNFIDAGVVKIPGFQRNYVWELTRASKLIESFIIGLPVPQIFLYEEARNSYLVIDGQQRLMTIFYFIKGRFPKQDKRVEIRNIFSQKGVIPKEIIGEDNFFTNFNLKLSTPTKGQKNKYNGKNYQTLGDDKTSLDLRTLRSILVKPSKQDDSSDSSIYELFNRLNTGGVNLSSQEIRVTLYHSDFMQLIIQLNNNSNWRSLLGIPVDLHMKDVEIILRAFAILLDLENYAQPMTNFINTFSKKMKSLKIDKITLIENIFNTFCLNSIGFENNLFRTKNNRFSSVLFEAVYYHSCIDSIEGDLSKIRKIEESKIIQLKTDKDFLQDSTAGTTTNTEVVKRRIKKAGEILL